MKLTFHDAKRAQTLASRGLDFANAERLFAGATLTLLDDRKEYGEERFQTIGLLDGEVVMVVWTPRGRARHVISMRKCNDRERKAYLHRLE